MSDSASSAIYVFKDINISFKDKRRWCNYNGGKSVAEA